MAKYHPNVDDYVVSRVRALESLLLEKGILQPGMVDRVIARYEADTGPILGSRLAARAWRDPAFKRKLLDRPAEALADFGLMGNDEFRAVEDTPEVHNLVVCTLCSCYPWDVMGLPPVWYKMPPYRSRAVLEPRKLLAEMGWAIPESREIRVWDSSAELRYMVLPERPAGAEGLSEDDLAALITRDALIGVEPVRVPSLAPA
jgi:nitrile hydratase